MIIQGKYKYIYIIYSTCIYYNIHSTYMVQSGEKKKRRDIIITLCNPTVAGEWAGAATILVGRHRHHIHVIRIYRLYYRE